MHTESSQLFRQLRSQIPQHTVHTWARTMVMLYFLRKYGQARFRKHAERVETALNNLDGEVATKKVIITERDYENSGALFSTSNN